ncbi:DUF2062 domain-containing protein [Alkalicella caledoniensis]|uniref:DUF2062 domain-containing protein n=1 Tax=Alkalicella caledoniensis TaxID=2731377 RepID=A0A7G9W581_ALKCA|nr:DUF2062 domain-containing protein [Alkalicella caledoniensis]QNO13843.1 DUF2062 domain-containing protein [Alkalicella caledoniensis]
MEMMLKNIWGKIQEIWKKVTTIKDTPHAIGLGAAIGLGWNFIPSLGIGPFVSVFNAKLFRGSGIAAVTVNLGTGFFIPLMYSLNMMTGRFIIGQWFARPEIEKQIQDSIQESIGNIEVVIKEPTRFFSLSNVTEFGFEFFLGGVINAIFFGAILYTIIWFPRYIKCKFFQKDCDTLEGDKNCNKRAKK